jgi:tetratricopeptide (TPR) repeat protein
MQGVETNRKSIVRWVASVVAIAAAGYSLASHAAGGEPMGGGGMPSGRVQSPQDMARYAYDDGVKAVKQAKKYEADAAEAREDKRAKANEKTRKQYEKARSYFAGAVSKQPTMHEAWNYIGFTSRKLGDTATALTAYNEALRLKPGYNEAIEYRGVAYLMINRIDDAKTAYMTLFRDDRKLADQLMVEMQQWLTVRRSEPSGVPGDQLDKFAEWVGERSTIAQQTASLAVDAPAVRWQ